MAKINIIKEDQWIEHYKELWCKQEEEQNNNPNLNDEGEIMNVDEISMSELQDALKATKDVRNQLNVYALNEKKTEYKERWKHHVNRMGNGRIPKKILNYNPRGKRDIGRPQKQWS